MKKKINKNSFFKSLSIMSLLTFVSRVLGYVRDLIFAFALGATPGADSFLLAFRMPNFFRRLFAEGAINNSLVPLFIDIKKKQGKQYAELFIGYFFSILLLSLLFVTIICEIFMHNILSFLAPGFSENMLEKTTFLARVMFPYLIFISISSLLGGLLNANNRYALWSFTPIILNLFMVFAMMYSFVNSFITELALSWAVIISGITQFSILFLWTQKKNIRIIFIKPKLTNQIKKLFRLLLPNILSGGIVQINQFVGIIFASTISGAISWLYYADRIIQLPLGIFIISITTIMLTILSKEKVNEKNKQQKIDTSIMLVLTVTFLSVIGLLVLSDLIVDVLFKRGKFGYGDAKATSDAIVMYSIGLPAFGLIKLFSIIFFSRQNTTIPFYISFLSMILNICLLFLLVEKLGHLGIALSLSLTSWLNAIVLFIVLHHKGYWILKRKTLYKIFKLVVVSSLTLFLIYSCYFFIIYTDAIILSTFLSKIILLSILIFITIFSFAVFSYIIGLINYRNLINKNVWELYEENKIE